MIDLQRVESAVQGGAEPQTAEHKISEGQLDMKCDLDLWTGVDLLIKIWSSGLAWSGHVNNRPRPCHNIIRSSNKLRNVA